MSNDTWQVLDKEEIVTEQELVEFLRTKLTLNESVPDWPSSKGGFLRIEKETEPNERKAKLHGVQYQNLSALLAACKKNKTTLQSAIVVALSYAQAAEINPEGPTKILVNTPVELRSLARRMGMGCKGKNTLGNFIGVPMVAIVVDPADASNEAFWEAARLVYASLVLY